MTMFFACIGGRKQRQFNCHFIRKQDSGELPLLPSPLSSLKIGVIPIPIEKRIPSLGIFHHLYRKRDLSDLNKFSKVLFPMKMRIKKSLLKESLPRFWRGEMYQTYIQYSTFSFILNSPSFTIFNSLG
jgi:hypothetical protein